MVAIMVNNSLPYLEECVTTEEKINAIIAREEWVEVFEACSFHRFFYDPTKGYSTLWGRPIPFRRVHAPTYFKELKDKYGY